MGNLFVGYGGTVIISSAMCFEAREDWSRVRSPSRAARRRKRGHRQNITLYQVPIMYRIGGTVYAHPDIIEKMRDEIDSQ